MVWCDAPPLFLGGLSAGPWDHLADSAQQAGQCQQRQLPYPGQLGERSSPCTRRVQRYEQRCGHKAHHGGRLQVGHCQPLTRASISIKFRVSRNVIDLVLRADIRSCACPAQAPMGELACYQC